MSEFESVQRSFSECALSLVVPRVIVAGPFVNIEFTVTFAKKTKAVKYLVHRCGLRDKHGNYVIEQVNDKTGFEGKNKHTISVKADELLKDTLGLTLSFLTMDEEYIEVKYIYKQHTPVMLESVSVRAMNSTEKDLFADSLLQEMEQIKNKSVVAEVQDEPVESKPFNRNMDDYVRALTCELVHLKNNGGKNHKVIDGHLLTATYNEFTYSFELESELYLSDNAPVTLTVGLNTYQGTVIVSDGFQLIVALNQNIGDEIQSAFINVEPWKLVEKLRDKLETITPKHKIAWTLFHDGPALADKLSNISTIKRGQDIAISHSINNDITVIWGPPGTGKTYTMARMVEEFVSLEKRILIVSHSNISVDNVVKQISNQFTQHNQTEFLAQGKVLRYGYVRDEELQKNENCVAFNYALNCYPELKQRYNSLSDESYKLKVQLQYKYDKEKAEKRKDIEKLLKSIRARLKEESQELTSKAQVVATTASKLYMDKVFEDVKYDVVMFDEVSMAYVPQLICAASYATEKFVCVGDFRQLAPIVQCERAKPVLEKDIFTFLNICQNNNIHNHPWLVMLNEQRRMHPHISLFSNLRIYKGLLRDHESVTTKWNDVVEMEPLSQEAISLVDLAGTYCAAGKNADNSRFNILSAILSFGIALKAEQCQNGLDFKPEEKVGVITPYAAQTRLIRALVQDYRQENKVNISCATVHQFQGSERNVIVFDAVESYPFTKPGWLVSKNDNGSVIRLINVALTRSRAKFITLASTKFWDSKFNGTQNTYHMLLEHIKKNNNVVSVKDNSLLSLVQQCNFGKNISVLAADDAFEKLLNDINSAKKQILISLPTDKLNPKYEGAIYSKIKERESAGVKVIGKAKDVERLNDFWKKLLFKSKDSVFPLIVIDNKITWYGFPLSELYFEDKNNRYLATKSPVFRITGKHTNEMISSLCDLENRTDERGFKVKLTEKTSVKNGMRLSAFVKENETCRVCGSAMELAKNPSGKYYLRCSSCRETDMLSKYSLNKYLDKINAKCDTCGRDLCAAVSQYGLYIKCNNGHFTKVSEYE